MYELMIHWITETKKQRMRLKCMRTWEKLHHIECVMEREMGIDLDKMPLRMSPDDRLTVAMWGLNQV